MQSPHCPDDRGKTAIHSRMLGKEELEQAKKVYMSSSYSTHFTKFRAMPKCHVAAVNALKCIARDKLSVKAMHHYLRSLSLDKTETNFILCVLQHDRLIDYLLKKITILEDFPFFGFYVMKVLLGQLLWGTQSIPLGTMESTNLLYYESDAKEAIVEADTVLNKSYVCKLPTYVRVNTLSISLEQCINAFCKEGWNLLTYSNNYSSYLSTISHLNKKEFVRDIHISELLVFPPGTSFYDHPGYLKGKFILQDKGSCLASFLLNPKPGSVVLDMCAAPGRTTNHLANIINNDGRVYAVENHPHRYNKLCSFLELTNVRCAETVWADNMQLSIDNINYILLDVPSTYTGLYYKRPRAGLGRRLKQYFHLSLKTLIWTLQTFTTAKRIVFSACTSHPEEGEKVISQTLGKLNDAYTLLDVKELLWNEWFTVGIPGNSGVTYNFANKCLRVNPDVDKSYAYFIAVFERNFDVPVPPFTWKKKVLNDCSRINQDESDDETLNDHSNERPKPAVPSLANKHSIAPSFIEQPPAHIYGKKPKPFVKGTTIPFAQNATASPHHKRSQKQQCFTKLKQQPSNSKQQYRPHPYLPNSQTPTSTSQMQTSYPGSQPFYEIEHSQLYP